MDVEVATVLAVDDGDALSGKPLAVARLRSCLDLDRCRSVEGGDVDGAAERSGGEVDREFEVDVGTVALEDIVGLHLEDDEEVAARATLGARCTFAAEAESLPGVDACGDLHLDGALHLGGAAAAAGLAGIGDDGAAPFAARAGGLDGEEALAVAYLARASTARAGCGLAASLGAGAAAGCAGLVAGHLDLLVGAVDGDVEGQAHAEFKVGSPLGGVGVAALAAELEELGEDVAEVREDIFGGVALATAAPEPRISKAVVACPLFGIGEDAIGLGCELELLLGRLVARVAVGVELERLCAIGLLDVIGRCILGHAQDVVEVCLFAHGFAQVRVARAGCDRHRAGDVKQPLWRGAQREDRNEGRRARISGPLDASKRAGKKDGRTGVLLPETPRTRSTSRALSGRRH